MCCLGGNEYNRKKFSFTWSFTLILIYINFCNVVIGMNFIINLQNQMMKLLLLISLPVVILGWWDVGHMLTAAIAEIKLNQLNPYASVNFRQLVLSINDLCDNRTRTFIQSAVWADDLKQNQYSMNIWNDWHFIDTPYTVDAMIPTVNYTQAAVASTVVVNQAKSVLSKNLKNNTAQRALFARYLVHLVGDIHQPLHSVALYNLTYPAGDQGGNKLRITLANKTAFNFHSFWDSGALVLQNDTYGFVRPMDLQNSTELKKIANGMINQYGSQVQELGKIIDPLIWAKQSFLIAQNTTYPHMLIKTQAQADDQYVNLVYQTSRKRITLAGYRLANFVISLYGDGPKQNADIQQQQNIQKVQKQGLWDSFMRHSQQNKDFFKFLQKRELTQN